MKPDQINMHLFVEGSKVMNVVGEHINPWDFKTPTHVDGNASPLDPKNPTWTVVPTAISPGMFTMLSENPTPITRW